MWHARTLLWCLLGFPQLTLTKKSILHYSSSQRAQDKPGVDIMLCIAWFQRFTASSSLLVRSSVNRAFPRSLRPSLSTHVVQSWRGLPTRRTKRPICGISAPSMKVSRLSAEPAGPRATLPNSRNCFCKSWSLSGRTPACANTLALDTLDTKAAGIPKIRRKHLA